MFYFYLPLHPTSSFCINPWVWAVVLGRGQKGPDYNLGQLSAAMNFLVEGSQTKYIDLHEAEESTLTQIKVLVLLIPFWQVKESKWF